MYAQSRIGRSLIIAVIVGLLSPALWFVVTGETKRTPIVQTSFFDQMTKEEIDIWIDENARPVPLLEHALGTPSFFIESWKGYLLSSGIVTMIVFVMSAAISKGGKNAP